METIVREIDESPCSMEELLRENRELKQQVVQLREETMRDGLTGLYKRKAFQDLLAGVIGEGKAVAVMFMDIDLFKGINDTHGHLVGDVVLTSLANVLNSGVLREEDIAGRFGGEEFIVVCPGLDRQECYEAAMRVSEQFKRLAFRGDGDCRFSATLSIGIAEYREEDADIYRVIDRADKAMYRAKEGGRDGVVVDGGGS